MISEKEWRDLLKYTEELLWLFVKVMYWYSNNSAAESEVQNAKDKVIEVATGLEVLIHGELIESDRLPEVFLIVPKVLKKLENFEDLREGIEASVGFLTIVVSGIRSEWNTCTVKLIPEEEEILNHHKELLKRRYK